MLLVVDGREQPAFLGLGVREHAEAVNLELRVDLGQGFPTLVIDDQEVEIGGKLVGVDKVILAIAPQVKVIAYVSPFRVKERAVRLEFVVQKARTLPAAGNQDGSQQDTEYPDSSHNASDGCFFLV